MSRALVPSFTEKVAVRGANLSSTADPWALGADINPHMGGVLLNVYRVRLCKRAENLFLGPYGIADNALASYTQFRALREAGRRPLPGHRARAACHGGTTAHRRFEALRLRRASRLAHRNLQQSANHQNWGVLVFQTTVEFVY